MIVAFIHLLAQTGVQEAQKKTAAEEGADIVLSMLVVGLVFVAVIAARRAERLAPPPLPPLALGLAWNARRAGAMLCACVTTSRPAPSRSSSPTWRARRSSCTARRRRVCRGTRGAPQVIREACAAEGGVEVDTQGDAFFFAFPTAPGAFQPRRRTDALAPARSTCASASTPVRRSSPRRVRRR